jgi:hypothetical protein
MRRTSDPVPAPDAKEVLLVAFFAMIMDSGVCSTERLKHFIDVL